jgi:hypothetical protein
MKVSCITKKYIILIYIQKLDVWFLQKMEAIYKHYTQVHKDLVFFSTFSAASFSSLLTASSIASLAIFITSNASFMAGSASGSYGSGGGESSATS